MADEDDSRSIITVGLITMFPHTCAKRHIHYGQEQVVYVISGSGRYVINDEERSFAPGDIVVMEADASHETINDSDEDIVELLVSVPVGKPKVAAGRTDDTFDEWADDEESQLLYQTTVDHTDVVKKITGLPYTVFDVHERPLLQSDSYPDICLKNCDPINAPGECECFSKDFGECDVEGKWVSCTCAHGLKTFLCPISYNNKLIGIIRGGHFFTSEKGAVAEDNEYDVPMTAQIAVHSVLDQIVETIENYIQYLASVKDLKVKEQRLAASDIANESLRKDLTDVSEQVTNLKINHHFLFNTLNCMSAMALDGDRNDLYRSIIDLSKMFRYTMAADMKMVSLRSELDYLKSYLNLQKLRYKDGLDIEFDIDDTCLETVVPFNFLQPIMENAFTHGFMSYDYDKIVRITISQAGGRVTIGMYNNGITPACADVTRIENGWRSGNGHGLSLIYEKLAKCYGGDFDMKLSVPDGTGTLFTVVIPGGGAE